jgi:hypothetical protein
MLRVGMLTALLHAHSGLRYLVLTVGLLAFLFCLIGFIQKKAFSKLHRILTSAFAGLLHLQVLLGITMVALGRYYPALIGHMVMMITAAVGSQVLLSLNRRKETPGLLFPLLATGGALTLIVGGILAIGRGVFQMSVVG